MRLFVAVELDPAVVRALAESSQELRRRTAALARRARVTWVPGDRLHVTVRFIGEIEPARTDHIVSVLQASLPVPAFTMECRGVGAFPSRGAPRVIWAGVDAGREELGALERAVSERLASCALEREKRPFRPHVTLARVREPDGLRPGPLLEGLVDRRFGSSAVGAITLFESRQSPEGSVYQRLLTTGLGS